MRVAAQLGPRSSEESFRGSWLASTRDVHLATAAAFGVISVRNPTRPQGRRISTCLFVAT
jgi:hypothetical protein